LQEVGEQEPINGRRRQTPCKRINKGKERKKNDLRQRKDRRQADKGKKFLGKILIQMSKI
jgi:hypothetical protein